MSAIFSRKLFPLEGFKNKRGPPKKTSDLHENVLLSQMVGRYSNSYAENGGRILDFSKKSLR